MPSDEYLDAYHEDHRRSSEVDNALWPKIARSILKELELRATGTDAFRILDSGAVAAACR